MHGKLVGAVAKTISSLRKQANLSQERLAADAGLDRAYLSGVERGVRNITLDSLEKIAIPLGVDLPEFLDEVRKHLLQKD